MILLLIMLFCDNWSDNWIKFYDSWDVYLNDFV